MVNQYLIAANSKKGQLIFNMFRPVDLVIALGGAITTIALFLILDPKSLLMVTITLLPIAVCSFLVIPIPNYHNILCILMNIYNFYFVEQRELKWKGWCAKYEFKN